jgi:hypothetical protein
MFKFLLSGAAAIILCCFSTNSNAQCLDWVSPTDSTGWSDFDPAPCTGESQEITAFEVYKSEAYQFLEVVSGGSYTFSHCNGPGAGTWTPEYTIIAPSGTVDAFGAGDGDGCSITWTASESGTYLVVINEMDNCGTAEAVDNGYPMITTNSGGGVCCGTYPAIVGTEIDCSDDGETFSVLVEFEVPSDSSFTLTNDINSDEITLDASGEVEIGPFTNGDEVLLTVSNDDIDGCSSDLGTLTGDCTEPCTEADLGTYNFVDDLDLSVPEPDGNNECEEITFDGFEVWASEGYIFPDMPAGVEYTFNICTGAGANTYPVNFAVTNDAGDVVASGSNDDDCSITWATGDAGTYTVYINAEGLCGIGQQVNNGNPSITCSGVVGVNDLEVVDAVVYPNPALNTLSIRSSMTGFTTVTIFDISGRQVMNEVVQLNNQVNTLDISNLESGAYTINVQGRDRVAVEKFIKQ